MAKYQEDECSLNMEAITVIGQNLNCIKLLLSKISDKNTGYKDFMIYGDRLMTILAEEALAIIPSVAPQDIVTPSGIFKGLEDTRTKQLCAVSIIRAGDTLLEAFRKLEPGIRIGKILIQRDEESKDKHPIFYYKKLPSDIADCFVLLVDPMLGTAGSCMCAMDCLVEHGVDPKNVLFVNLLSCKYGLQKLQAKFPDLKVITFNIDGYLNDDKYLVPGIGDFGDRYYGTNH